MLLIYSKGNRIFTKPPMVQTVVSEVKRMQYQKHESDKELGKRKLWADRMPRKKEEGADAVGNFKAV